MSKATNLTHQLLSEEDEIAKKEVNSAINVNGVINSDFSKTIGNNLRKAIEDHEDVRSNQPFTNAEEKCFNSSFQNCKNLALGLLFCYGNFISSVCLSLQAPFFPSESTLKGLTPSQYGLVFSVYEIVFLIMTPLFGVLISRICPVRLYCLGALCIGTNVILFGCLDFVDDSQKYLIAALVLRSFEGLGQAAMLVSGSTLLISHFSGNAGVAFSAMETAYWLGMIVGPTLGAIFFKLGGFILPFAVIGISTLLLLLVAPFIKVRSKVESNLTLAGIVRFLSSTSLIVDSLLIVTVSAFVGFTSVTLEPHIRSFDISNVLTVGGIFMITGIAYSLSAPIWGRLCDRFGNQHSYLILSILGCLFCLIGQLFIGPIPTLKSLLPKHVSSLAVSLALFGIGNASKMICSFTHILGDAINKRNFANDYKTTGLVSSVVYGVCSLGILIGSATAGVFQETIGFENGTMIYALVEFALIALLALVLVRDILK